MELVRVLDLQAGLGHEARHVAAYRLPSVHHKGVAEVDVPSNSRTRHRNSLKWTQATTSAGCNLTGYVLATTSATGVLPKTKFKVHESWGKGASKIKCNPSGAVAGGCALVVANASTQAKLAGAPISFAS
jgi:hypothetical protein